MSREIEINNIDVDPFVEIECPYCYNIRNMDGGYFNVEAGECTVYCPTCGNPIILKIFIPRRYIENLGLESKHLPVEE